VVAFVVVIVDLLVEHDEGSGGAPQRVDSGGAELVWRVAADTLPTAATGAPTRSTWRRGGVNGERAEWQVRDRKSRAQTDLFSTRGVS